MPVELTSPSGVAGPGALPATYLMMYDSVGAEAAPCYARFLDRQSPFRLAGR